MSDLIDRQQAINVANKTDYDGLTVEDVTKVTDAVVDGLMRLPSVQPQRKKGKWTDDNACPFCGFQPWYERDIHTLSFCPNCGADMRGDSE